MDFDNWIWEYDNLNIWKNDVKYNFDSIILYGIINYYLNLNKHQHRLQNENSHKYNKQIPWLEGNGLCF